MISPWLWKNYIVWYTNMLFFTFIHSIAQPLKTQLVRLIGWFRFKLCGLYKARAIFTPILWEIGCVETMCFKHYMLHSLRIKYKIHHKQTKWNNIAKGIIIAIFLCNLHLSFLMVPRKYHHHLPGLHDPHNILTIL